MHISIHAPAKGATVKPKVIDKNRREFQSTLPRRERLLRPFFIVHAVQISIHAPAKGATMEKLADYEDLEISIHAPAKGATNQIQNQNLYSRFQSTLPRRERRQIQMRSFLLMYFNPRSREGSDRSTTNPNRSGTNFNPRSREGSDAIRAPGYESRPDFNPRSREGSDLTISRIGQRLQNFNPRSREGSDHDTWICSVVL